MSKSQVANYVNNGSFEVLKDCIPPVSWTDLKVKYWTSIDTTKVSFFTLNKCLLNVPFSGSGFQKPRTGDGFLLSTYLDISSGPMPNRGYLRNKLKYLLKPNTVYCVKFHVNIINLSAYGIDGFGAYFGDNTLDTIKYHMARIAYLSPQVQNPSGNIIKDTLNWVPITGTFTANGTEKYMVIGNFKSDAVTGVSQIQTSVSSVWCDVNVDDVSVIELNLPAFAGRDTSVAPGSAVFLGRQPDVGIDEACVWYKLPGTTPIDTIAGFWVQPTTTSTYVVEQTICGLVKRDTVVVHMNLAGNVELEMLNDKWKLWPNPVDGILVIETQRHGEFLTQRHKDTEALGEDFKVQIINSLGQIIREEEIEFKNYKAQIQTSDLTEGVYILLLKSNNQNTLPNGAQQTLWQAGVSKRFVISR